MNPILAHDDVLILSVTPYGVEHKRVRYIQKTGVNLILSVTPYGVEHIKVWASAASASVSDIICDSVWS